MARALPVPTRAPWPRLTTNPRYLSPAARATPPGRPVLLGGIYAATSAPQGQHGSASDVWADQKRAVQAADLQRTIRRFRVELNWHPKHPVRSVNGAHARRRRMPATQPARSPARTAAPALLLPTRQAMRMLCAIPDSHRGAVSHALYRAYWVEGADVSDPDVLLAVRTQGVREHARPSGGSRAAPGAYWDGVLPQVARKQGSAVDASCFSSETYKEQLRRNTDEAVERGSPGVPAFWVGDQLFWGGDRLHFVDRALGNPRAALPRICPPPPGGVVARRRLTVYHDFSSPWRYASRGMAQDGGPHAL